MSLYTSKSIYVFLLTFESKQVTKISVPKNTNKSIAKKKFEKYRSSKRYSKYESQKSRSEKMLFSDFIE